MRVRVRIERIVVEGSSLSRADEAAFCAATKAELARLFLSTRQIRPSLAKRDAVVSASTVASLSKPKQLGRQTAGHVFGVVRGGKGGGT